MGRGGGVECGRRAGGMGEGGREEEREGCREGRDERFHFKHNNITYVWKFGKNQRKELDD